MAVLPTANDPANETKPGVYTTEFWLSIAVGLINFLNLVGIWNYMPNKYSAFVMSVVTGLYALSRGVAKSSVKPGVPTGPSVNVTNQ